MLASVQMGRPTEILRPRFSKLPSTNRVQNTKLINVPCYYWLRKSPPMLCIDRYLPVSDTGTLGQTEDTFVGGSGGNRGGIGSRKWHFLHFEGTFELNLKDSNHIYSVKCYDFKKI